MESTALQSFRLLSICSQVSHSTSFSLSRIWIVQTVCVPIYHGRQLLIIQTVRICILSKRTLATSPSCFHYDMWICSFCSECILLVQTVCVPTYHGGQLLIIQTARICVFSRKTPTPLPSFFHCNRREYITDVDVMCCYGQVMSLTLGIKGKCVVQTFSYCNALFCSIFFCESTGWSWYFRDYFWRCLGISFPLAFSLSLGISKLSVIDTEFQTGL